MVEGSRKEEKVEGGLIVYTTHIYSTSGALYTSLPATGGGTTIVTVPSTDISTGHGVIGGLVPGLRMLPLVPPKHVGGSVTGSTALASVGHTVHLTVDWLGSVAGPMGGPPVLSGNVPAIGHNRVDLIIGP